MLPSSNSLSPLPLGPISTGRDSAPELARRARSASRRARKVLSIRRDASSAGKTPLAGNGASRPRLMEGICWECIPAEEGTSGSGPVGGGEGGGRSSKKRGRGLGTMNSEDEIIERSDSAGETPRRNGGRGEGVARGRGAGERKGLDSEGEDMRGALRSMECRGEGEADGGFEPRVEVIGSEIFGRDGRLSGTTGTSDGDGGMGNVLSDGLKRVEGVKRTPCGRGAAGAGDNCSREEPGDKARLSASCDRARGGYCGAVSQDGMTGETGENWPVS